MVAFEPGDEAADEVRVEAGAVALGGDEFLEGAWEGMLLRAMLWPARMRLFHPT